MKRSKRVRGAAGVGKSEISNRRTDDWRAATPATTRAALLGLDPRNITLEPEYYADVDQERYARVKPLLWLW